MAASAKKKEEATNEGTQDLREAIGAIVEELVKRGLNFDTLKENLSDLLQAANIEPTDENIEEAIHRLHKSGKLDDTLRQAGLVPRPGFFSAITGWHEVEHLRSKGFTNKLVGAKNLGMQIGLMILGAVHGYRWYQARG